MAQIGVYHTLHGTYLLVLFEFGKKESVFYSTLDQNQKHVLCIMWEAGATKAAQVRQNRRVRRRLYVLLSSLRRGVGGELRPRTASQVRSNVNLCSADSNHASALSLLIKTSCWHEGMIVRAFLPFILAHLFIKNRQLIDH